MKKLASASFSQPLMMNSKKKLFPNAHCILQSHSVLLIVALIFVMIPAGTAIDCFKCVSLDNTNPECHDPFHNNYSHSILESPCFGGRKNRNGLFPATACIKLNGRFTIIVASAGRNENSIFSNNYAEFLQETFRTDTNEDIIVRGCELDSGTLTTDTELIRMSHCGAFYYNNRYVKGCIQACSDSDGCNGGRLQFCNNSGIIFLSLLGLTIFKIFNKFSCQK